MPLPRRFFAPSFRQNHLGWYFAALVGIMVSLASFAMAAEAGLSAFTYSWDRNMQNRLTVEIPMADDESAMPQPERVKQALAILKVMPGVRQAKALPDEATAKLLSPWIDQPDLLKVLPIPSLIDVEREAGSVLTADMVYDRLKPGLRDVKVEDHAIWLASLARFVRGLAAIGGLMIGLTMLTLVISVSLLCRAIMATERETLSLLHALGAEDTDVARHFARHARRLSGMAALSGFIPALALIATLAYFLRGFALPAGFNQTHAALLAATLLTVPLAAICIASVTARLSVLSFLRRLP